MGKMRWYDVPIHIKSKFMAHVRASSAKSAETKAKSHYKKKFKKLV